MTATAAPKQRTIAILLFDGVEELDFAGPWEVFASLARAAPALCAVHTVSQQGGQVACSKGLRVMADFAFADAPAADLLIVPGGDGRRREVHNPVTVDYIRRAAQSAEAVASVCTGAFLLHAAGLLDGRPAATYHFARDELRGLGVDVREQRWVDAWPIVTASGVSAGIDMSLYLVARLWGAAVARRVQQGIEYFPAPPDLDRLP